MKEKPVIKKSRRERMKRIVAMTISGVLVLALVASLLSSMLWASALTASNANLKKLKDQQAALAKDQKAAQADLAAAQKDKQAYLAQKAALDRQYELTEQDIELSNSVIAELSAQLEVKTQELADAEAREAEEEDLFQKRLRAMYENDTSNYMSVLLASDSLTDFLTRYEIVSQIIDYDRALLERLEQTRLEVAEAKAELETTKADEEAEKAALVEKKNSLAKQSAERDALIKKAESEEENAADELKKLAEEEDKVQAQIKKMVAELAAKNNSQYVGGVLDWPCPGYYTITSPYGMRYHPVLKVNKLHTGCDISAPKGASILAANSGTVIISSYSSAWGNYVVIDHGGKVATLYAHMSKRIAAKGDKVSKGDKIGLVGSTGWSTGNHLHFEVQVNGKSVDPMQYFKKAS